MKNKERTDTCQIMFALSLAPRWCIMEVLTEHAREMTIAEIIPALDGKLSDAISYTSTAQHLDILVEAGLVICRKGTTQNYYLCSNPHFFLYLVALCTPMTKERGQ